MLRNNNRSSRPTLVCCRLAAVLCCAALAFSARPAAAEDSFANVERAEQQLEDVRLAIERDRQSLNVDCANVRSSDTARVQECRRRFQDVKSRMLQYRIDLAALAERRKKFIGTGLVVPEIVHKEQAEFENRYPAWLDHQQELIRLAVASETKQNQELLSAMNQNLAPQLPQKTLNDLKSGDVILMRADRSGFSSAIPYGDLLSRWLYASHQAKKYDVSHTVVYLKSVNGKRLYLDHQLGDKYARIIDEDMFLHRYAKRLSFVARPKAPIDGKKLWQAARGAALQDHTPYGLFGDSLVCSELARLAIVQASGKRLPVDSKRFGPDIAPADFIDPESKGKFFVVTPLTE